MMQEKKKEKNNKQHKQQNKMDLDQMKFLNLWKFL